MGIACRATNAMLETRAWLYLRTSHMRRKAVNVQSAVYFAASRAVHQVEAKGCIGKLPAVQRIESRRVERKKHFKPPSRSS